MSTETHRSFAGGELAPALYSRVDLVKYQTGLRTCRNMMVMRHGGAQNRPGTKFVGEVKDSSKTVRLIPFVFNENQAYALEFGDLYMRVHKNGAPGLEPTKSISAITLANPGVFTSVAHGYSNGQEVFVKNIEGLVDLNNRNFKIAGVTANTYTLQYMDGTNVNTSAMPPYTTILTTGVTARVYTISSPYAFADLPDLKFDQSADIVYLTHPSYQPYKLSRTGDLAWTITALTFLPSISRPTGLAGTIGTAGNIPYVYKVTAISKADGSESLCAKAVAKVITGITLANPAVVTSVAHGFPNGAEIVIEGVVGMTQVNDEVFIVSGVTANTFQLQGINSTGYTAYSSGGNAFRDEIALTSKVPTDINPNSLSWNLSASAEEYNIYRAVNGQWGLLGTSTVGSFNDIGIAANGAKTPPIFRNPFKLTGDFPATVAFHQQRLAFGGGTNNPQTINESRVGEFNDFSIRSPLQDDDALEYTLAGKRVEAIRHLLFMDQLLAFTSGAEFSIDGGDSAAVTPFSIAVKQHSGHGSSRLRPINIDGTALFTQARGSKVRDYNFDFDSDGYQGNDLSIFSAHLFDGFSLADWDFAQEPNPIVWAVRNDGLLLGLTYVRDQQIFAWHKHDTDGFVENVVVIPEGQSDAVYLVVKREIMLNGVSRTVRYVERMAERLVSDQRDAVFMDSALSFDGRQTNSIGMTLTGSGWTYIDLLTLAGGGAMSFRSTDVGNQIFLTGSDGTQIRFTISVYVNANTVQGFPHKTVPVSMQGVPITVWQYAVDEISGLWHLEGKFVSVLGDALVVASPGSPKYTRLQVTNGKITLDKPYSVIYAGLFYPSDLESLDIDTDQGESLIGKGKIVNKLNLFFQESRGGWCGDRPPKPNPGISEVADNESYITGMAELKLRQFEDWGEPTDLLTGPADAIVAPIWNKNGRVFFRQVDPLPMAVLAIAPTGLTRPN